MVTARSVSASEHPISAALHKYQQALLAASRLWSQKIDFDESMVDAIRHQAILQLHQWYLEHIPAYRHLAKERSLLASVDVETLVNELMFPTDLFKSYDPAWLASGAYDCMTAWLGTIFSRPPQIDLAGVQNIATWQKRLREDQIYLTYSSGTSGRFSFVPRDRFTLAALAYNGQHYSHTHWGNGSYSSVYDCLILGPRGVGTGLQAAGEGLARGALRSHFLFDVEMDADILRILQGDTALKPGTASDQALQDAERFRQVTVNERERAYRRAIQFLQRATADQRRVLVFGPPFQVEEFCSYILGEGKSIHLPHDSIVVTGGGWKSHKPIKHEQLLNHINSALGVARGHTLDTYSTAECNCVFMTCREDRYHIPPLIEIVVLDDLLMRISGDERFGTIGFLDPFAHSYPGFIITGDEARLVREPCACGLAGWSIVGKIQRAANASVKGCAGVMHSAIG